MVVDRLVQIEPKVLFSDDGQFYNGKRFGVLDKVADIVKHVTSVEIVVVSDVIGEAINGLQANIRDRKVFSYQEFLHSARGGQVDLAFVQLPPDHPIYILYSSGTTGESASILWDIHISSQQSALAGA